VIFGTTEEWKMLDEFWKVLAGLGGVSVILVSLGTFVVWLTRTTIQQFLNKSLEKYKTDLKNAGDREIEHIRNDLKKEALEHEVKFRKAHDQVADVMVELFLRLSKFYASVESYLAPFDFPGETKESKGKVVGERMDEFVPYLLNHQLFLPEVLFQDLKEFRRALFTVSIQFKTGFEHAQQSSFGKDTVDVWHKADLALKELHPKFAKLRADFQTILGLRKPAE
jgi:hypothetical protein